MSQRWIRVILVVLNLVLILVILTAWGYAWRVNRRVEKAMAKPKPPAVEKVEEPKAAEGDKSDDASGDHQTTDTNATTDTIATTDTAVTATSDTAMTTGSLETTGTLTTASADVSTTDTASSVTATTDSLTTATSDGVSTATGVTTDTAATTQTQAAPVEKASDDKNRRGDRKGRHDGREGRHGPDMAGGSPPPPGKPGQPGAPGINTGGLSEELANLLKTKPLFGRAPQPPVTIQGVLGDQVLINNQWISPGASAGPVKLVEVKGGIVVIEIDGKRQERKIWQDMPNRPLPKGPPKGVNMPPPAPEAPKPAQASAVGENLRHKFSQAREAVGRFARQRGFGRGPRPSAPESAPDEPVN